LTCIVADNQDAAYSEVGSGWASYSEQGAYLNNFRYHAASNQADALAVWTVNNLSTEQDALYQVFATWHEAGNRTNAQFTVLDGDTAIKTTVLNQTFAPNDATLNSQNWESIGVVHSDTGTLKVELSDLAQNGYVIADAICIARLPQTTAATTLVDDGDANYVESGSGWLGWNENAFNGDIRYHAAGTDGAAATWDFDNLDTSLSYRVLVTWSPSFNRAQDSPFSVLDGSQVLNTTRLNQQFAADDVQIDGRGWESLGVFQASSGSLSVQLGTNASSGYVIADAVQLVSVTPPTTTPTVIDDGDINYVEHGDSWRGWSESGAFGGDFRYAPGGTGDNYADWQFAGLAAGTYDIYVTWHEAGNRATNSLYSVMQGEPVLASTRLNQQNAPSGVTASGQVWQSIGQVTIADGNITVRLSDSDANGFIIADAARIELVNLAPKIAYLQGGPNPNVAGSVLNLRAADVENDDGEVAAVQYYHDTDGNGVLEPNIDELLGTDTDGSNGWSWSGTMPAAPVGATSQTYFAQAMDDQGLTSNAAALSVSAGVYAILDDSMPGYAETGTGWTDVFSESDFLGTSRRHDGAASTTGDGAAVWTYENIPERNYDLQVTWQADENLASNALFEIYDGTILITTRRVDQTTGPSDVNADGAWWKSLGTFRLTSGTAVVKLLSADADAPVAADAVRLFDPPTVTITDSDCYEGQPYAYLIISATDVTEEFTVDWTAFYCCDSEIVGNNYEHQAQLYTDFGMNYHTGQVTFSPSSNNQQIICVPVDYVRSMSDDIYFNVNFSGGDCEGSAVVTMHEHTGGDFYIDGPVVGVTGVSYGFTEETYEQFSSASGGQGMIFWGNGDYSVVNNDEPTHNYSTCGTYPVFAILSEGNIISTSNVINLKVGEHAAAGSSDYGPMDSLYAISLAHDDWFSLFPMDYYWSVDWGDGESETIDGNDTFASHIYEEPGGYTVTAINGNTNNSYTYTSYISVNVLPNAYIEGPDTVVYHDQYEECNLDMDVYNLTVNGEFGDYWHIDWGDGQSEDNYFPYGGSTASHYYLNPGEYDIQAWEHYTDNNDVEQNVAANTQHVSVAENMLSINYGDGQYGSYGWIEGSIIHLPLIMAYETQSDATFNWHTYGQSAEAGTDYIYGCGDNNTWYYTFSDDYTFLCEGGQDQDGEYSGTLTIGAGCTEGLIIFTLPNTSDPIHLPKDFYIYFSTQDDIAVDYENAYVPIKDNNYGLILESVDAYSGDGIVYIPITRNYSSYGEDVHWSLTNGTASYGENANYWVEAYGDTTIDETPTSGTNCSGTIYFAEGETTKYLNVYLNEVSQDLTFSYCASTATFNGDPDVTSAQGHYRDGLNHLKMNLFSVENMSWKNEHLDGIDLGNTKYYSHISDPIPLKIEGINKYRVFYKLELYVTIIIDLDKIALTGGGSKHINRYTAYGHEQRHVQNYITLMKRVQEYLDALGALQYDTEEMAISAGEVIAKDIWNWWDKKSNAEEKEEGVDPKSPGVGEPYYPINGRMPTEPS
jgi:hypothetical protein